MIRTEHIDMAGRDFIRTYSDAGRYVVGGEPYGEYTEAIDPAEHGRTYTEGDIIPPPYVLDAEDVGAQTPFLAATVTIATTDWQAATSGYACTKTVTGMTDDAAVFLQYSDSETDYTATQNDDEMTFACDAVPSEAVTVSVLWFKAVSA